MMSAVALPAHFDGHKIVLDEPYPLEQDTLLTVIILSTQDDDERADWARLGQQNLAAAYGDDEPEYTFADIKEWNPLYKGPRH
jgi:hypothetical protein